MRIGVFILLILPSIITGCKEKKADNRVSHFYEAIAPNIGRDPDTESATIITNSIPKMSEVGIQCVYVVNASCSSCIAQALDCYLAYRLSESALPFIFLSKAENLDVFRYYYGKSYEDKPFILYSAESVLLQDGLYVIDNNTVVSYSKWDIK